MKFIGHLDLLKIVQRTVVRAKLPISYSNGFNPHQQMSFALPLSLSVESVAEYLDIELDEKVELEVIKNSLNAEFPNGLRVLDVVETVEGRKHGAAELRVASYDVFVTNNDDDTVNNIVDKVALINSSNEVKVMKKTKRSFEEVDIKQDIYSLEFNKDTNIISMLISTGSQRNIKPDLIIDFIGIPKNQGKIKRTEMFLENDGKFLPLI